MTLRQDSAEIQKTRARILVSDRWVIGRKWRKLREAFRGRNKKECYSAAWDFVIEDYQPVYEDKHGALSLQEAHYLAEWLGKRLCKK